MAELDEKTRDAIARLRDLADGETGPEKYHHVAVTHLEQLAQHHADLLAALDFAANGGHAVMIYSDRVAAAALVGAPVSCTVSCQHDGTGHSIASALIRTHKESTGG